MRAPSRATIGCLAAMALLACANGSTPPCGSRGEPCCNSVVCDTGLVCLSGACGAPGGGGGGGGSGRSSGNATGGGTTTASSTSSSSSSSSGGATTTAPACGGVSEACCAGGSCNGSLVCQGGSCAQPASGVSGTPCGKNSDCPTGICLPVGQPTGQNGWTGNVCSTTCTSAASCVAGWSCSALAGQTGDVCQCSYSPEVCDGKDDDCDGVVDDEPAVDQACGRSYATGSACQAGGCACPAGETDCRSACVSLGSTSNCGSCGNACAAGAACASGQCQCPTGQTVCGSTCVNTGSDGKNCGSCGQACTATGESCVSGHCQCPAGQTVCGSTCVDTGSDSQNCGSCGTACTVTGESCVSGKCQCPSGQAVCQTPCPNYHGSCGSQCCAGCIQDTSDGQMYCSLSPAAPCSSDSQCLSQILLWLR